MPFFDLFQPTENSPILKGIFACDHIDKIVEFPDTADDERAVSSAGLEQGTSNSQVGGSSPPRLAIHPDPHLLKSNFGCLP